MSETRHTVDPKFVVALKGKQCVLYVGLLDAAHRAGMASMSTEILQYPHAENDQTCIVRAEVTMEVGAGGRKHTFTGIGDANPRNVGANIAPHFIRMAETRAKARALRDALNVGMVTIEELGGDEDAAPQPATPARQRAASVASLSASTTDLRPAAPAVGAAGSPKRSLAEVMREVAPLAAQVRTNDESLSRGEYERYHALEAEAKALYTDLRDTILNDEADPKARRMALHHFYDSADTIARLNQRVEAVKKSGLPAEDLDKAFTYHHKRLAEQLAPPASIAG